MLQQLRFAGYYTAIDITLHVFPADCSQRGGGSVWNDSGGVQGADGRPLQEGSFTREGTQALQVFQGL